MKFIATNYTSRSRESVSTGFNRKTEQQEISPRFKWSGSHGGEIKSGGKNTSKSLKGRKRRNARGDGRGILLEIQRDVNILLYIEPARQSKKVFSDEARAAPFSSVISERFRLPLLGLVSQPAEKEKGKTCRKTTIQ